MKFISKSSLSEYAELFWKRQRRKEDPQDKNALDDINNGGDPLCWLRKKYSYKLPRPDNDIVMIASLNQEEVEALLIQDHTVEDKWMQEHHLVPEPRTRVLRELARIGINQRHFNGCRCEGCKKQQENYREWLAERSLEGVITADEKTLIQYAEPGKYEIVDGWGRLLPFATLLQEGIPFHPVESFVAWKSGVDVATQNLICPYIED